MKDAPSEKVQKAQVTVSEDHFQQGISQWLKQTEGYWNKFIDSHGNFSKGDFYGSKYLRTVSSQCHGLAHASP